ncbi:small membrane A-kinase anchor protein isoform X2 [Passer montanus]|uniref:small membrane A-kinase anchor protein isoform X2 n=1 Tax=Passer montanus TaxID=9160 RepID=UPI00196221F1|nr:small membrane A-kinase anchor protein isoform X2 [Passer montanus]
MDFDGGFASLPFRSLEEEEEAAASVGRGPDPRAPPEEGAARRAGTVRGGAALPARCSHGHRPAAPISSEEAQKEMFCSLKITGATGKKQRHCIEGGNHFQLIKPCC